MLVCVCIESISQTFFGCIVDLCVHIYVFFILWDAFQPLSTREKYLPIRGCWKHLYTNFVRPSAIRPYPSSELLFKDF